MAKHRLADRRARARVPIPAHMVDLGTGTSHLLTLDATADPTVATPRVGGLDALPAALVDPGTGYCWDCRSSIPGPSSR